MLSRLSLFLIALSFNPLVYAAEPSAFDGTPWHVSSGNLSVSFIQASPIGAFPRPDVLEPPPSVDSQVHLKKLGLIANEDYLAWGAIEREPGRWQWKQHDAMEEALHKAGLTYTVYDWLHFPPVWLRDRQTNSRTLMRCLEHNQECNYLSIFDPRTIAWYDHFYKHLHDHFSNRVDNVYACILGPYGEGNYPLRVPDWVNMGHCHEGYWCGDEFAVRAFQSAMQKKYSRIGKLNRAWGVIYRSFGEIRPPRELHDTEDLLGPTSSPSPPLEERAGERRPFKPSPASFSTPQDKRRWLDFITWYHQAIIDFAEQSVRALLKYYPAEKIRLKPGGSAGGVNPISWGTYCPGYARMARNYSIVLQPADCQGAVFADKWMGTAYQFYHVKECTEPAGNLSDKDFVRRMFSDASSGASQFFTYEFEKHAPAMQKYVHLLTGQPGETEIALYCPTTLYRLGGDLQPTIKTAYLLRDLCEFDVLDEALITDGALTKSRYKVLLILQPDIVDQPILDKFNAFLQSGGKVVVADATGALPSAGEVASICNIEARLWKPSRPVQHIASLDKTQTWLKDLRPLLSGLKGVDGQLDGLWTCKRGEQVFVFNSKTNAVAKSATAIPPASIWEK
jgi:hypothetical protein